MIVAGCKGARLDWLVEKCTELGVTSLVLAEFARSVVHVSREHLDKLQRVAVEACKQCGRNWIPELELEADPAGRARAESQRGMVLVAHPDCAAPRLHECLTRGGTEAGGTAIVIGPEGGISEEELERLRRAGGQLVSLVEFTLRVETAAVAAAAIWGDLARG